MYNKIIKNVSIVNDGGIINGDILIKGNIIEKIGTQLCFTGKVEEIDGGGLHLLPGVIDDQVHFREPGLTHKATIASESRAAVAGGVTTFMEMPNTVPPALTLDLLHEKYNIASQTSLANYSFYMGVSNDNVEEVLKVNKFKHDICGVKIFMGASTGNMLVDNFLTLDKIFEGSELLIATHCEDEKVINENKKLYPNPDHASYHPLIRNEEACFESSFTAVQLAKKHDSRLHILHISTEKELQLFTNLFPLEQKRITSEVCVHHLHFTADDYEHLGNQIKCNPAIKKMENKTALWKALLDDRLDIIATDHAPHTWDEKQQQYIKAPAGVPLVQHSLLLMLQYYKSGKISLEKMVQKMCHAPARCFRIDRRGYISEGYFADLILVDLAGTTTVTKKNILYKCNWSPFEGTVFPSKIQKTFVNGNLVFDNGQIIEGNTGVRLKFVR